MQKEEIIARVEVKKGNRLITGRMIGPADAVITIGRHGSNDIVLNEKDDTDVSRIHAAIIRIDAENKASRYIIRDLGSAQGVKLKGNYIHKKILNVDDELHIAKYTLTFKQECRLDRTTRIGHLLDRFARLPDESVSDQETGVQHKRNHEARRFPDEQREFLENLGRGLLAANFRHNPGRFMDHLIDVVQADKGFIVMEDQGRAIVKYQKGFDRELTIGIEIGGENPCADGPFHQEGSLCCPLSDNTFLAVFRSVPPAFNDNDLNFLCRVCESVQKAEGLLNDIQEVTEWPTSFVGLPDKKKQCLEIAGADAKKNNDVLIIGETGTGKEVLARFIHKNSPRKNRQYTSINCAVLTKELVHSELFGHKRGAFTGAAAERKGAFRDADGGILFLDEIGELPENIQATLLTTMVDRMVRPLGSDERQEVNVQILAATDRNIEDRVRSDTFRRALYERFAHKILVPPLRERKGEIPLFAYYFLDMYSKDTVIISRDALECMREYDWPGNVREMQNVVRDLTQSKKEIIFSWHLPPHIRHARKVEEYKDKIQKKTLKENECEIIKEVLRETRGNMTQTAKILKINRQTLYNKKREYSIPDDYGRS